MLKSKIIKSLLSLVLIIYLSFPSKAFTKAQNDEGIPNWVNFTFISITLLALGKWSYDKIRDNIAHKNIYTDADSSSFALQYLLSGDSLKQFKKLKSEQERSDYADRFWNKHDIYSGDSVNELRDEFEERIAYANKYYTVAQKKGWRSDKGRIYIIYGKPDDISISPFANDNFLTGYLTKSIDIELWIYDQPSGGMELPPELVGLTGRRFFLFARLSGDGRYRQIFSSEPEELNDLSLFQKPIGSR